MFEAGILGFCHLCDPDDCDILHSTQQFACACQTRYDDVLLMHEVGGHSVRSAGQGS